LKLALEKQWLLNARTGGKQPEMEYYWPAAAGVAAGRVLID